MNPMQSKITTKRQKSLLLPILRIITPLLLFTALMLPGLTSVAEAVIIEKQIPLLVNREVTTTSATYVDLGNYASYVLWEAAKYPSATVYFEAVIKNSVASTTTYAALSTSGTLAAIAGSEISITSATYTLVRSGSISLSDATEYKVIIRRSANTGYIKSARLIIKIDTATISSIETHIPFYGYATSAATSPGTIADQPIYYHDSSSFDGTLNVYFEATLWNSTAGQTAYARLYNVTTSAAVAGSQISVTGTTKARARSAALTLPTGNEYVVQIWASANSTYISSATLLVYQSGTIATTETHIPFILQGNSCAATSYTNLEGYYQWTPGNWSGVTNTALFQTHAKGSAATSNIYTQLYNSSDTVEIDARTFGESTTWARQNLSSPLGLPSANKNLIVRQKYGVGGGTSSARIIVLTRLNTDGFRVEKQVQLQSRDAMGNTGTSWISRAYVSGYPTFQRAYTGVPFKYESAKYTSPKFYFEAVIKAGTGATYYATAALYKYVDGGAGDVMVTGSQVWSNSYNATVNLGYEILRSGEVTLENGAEYYVKAKSSSTNYHYLHTSRLVIYQDATTLEYMETHPHLTGYNSRTNSAYAEVDYPTRYYYDDTKFNADQVTAYFEAGLYVASGTGYAVLYDLTAGATVKDAGSNDCEVSSTNTSTNLFERKRYANPCLLTSGHEYTVQIKHSSTGTVELGGARLVIQQVDPLRTESYYPMAFEYRNNIVNGGPRYYANTTYTDAGRLNHLNTHEPQDISDASATYYHEMTWKINSGYTGYYQLYSCTDNLCATKTTLGSEQSTTSTSTVRSRIASSLTMPTEARYLTSYVRVNNASGQLQVYGSRLIVQSVVGIITDLNVLDHSAGQEEDKFTASGSVTGAELFAFRLRNNIGTDVTVNQIEFPFIDIDGIAQGDFANLNIYIDSDDDGTIEGGETTTVGGSGSVDVGVTKITFSTPFVVAAGDTVNYILKGDISNVELDDTVTIGLGYSNVTLASGTISKSASNATHLADGTLTLADHGSGQVGDAFSTSTPVTDVMYRFKLTQAGNVEIEALDVNFTTAGGVANGDVSNCELWQDDGDGVYEGAGQDTLIQGSVAPAAGVITFTTNFTPSTGGTVYFVRATVSNLVPTDTTTFSMGTADIDPVASVGTVTESGSATSAIHTADGGLTLADHDSGQVGDALGTSTPVTDVFFRFKLTRAGDFQVSVLRVNYTVAGGIVDADITAGALYVDVNNNGTYEAGTDTAVQTGIAGASGKLTFTTAFQPATGGTNYLVRTQISNLVPGDQTTFSVGTADIDTTYSGGVTKSGSISNATHTADGTLTLADHSSGQVSDKFTTTTPVTDVLFRFRLTRAGDFQVDALRVNYTTGSGIVDADVTAGALYVDVNNNGTYEAGTDTAVQTGIAGSGGKLTFTTNFTPATGGTNYLVLATVSNLVGDDTTTFSVGTADTDTTYASGVTKSGSTSNATHLEDGTLTLANHDLGQVTDKFSTTSPVTDVFYRFKLTRVGTITVDSLSVNYTVVGGVVDGDVTSGQLYVDVNNDGLVDGGDTLIEGSVSGSGDKLTFTTDFSPDTGGTNYLVKATISNLVPDDTSTFSMTTSDITLVQTSAAKTGTSSNVTHTAEGSLTLADHGSGQVGDVFSTATSVTDVLYRFMLTQAGGAEVTTLKVNFTTTGGVASTDVSLCALWQDDGDGIYEGAGQDTPIQESVTPVTGVITFINNFTPGTGGTIYFVRATVSNLVPADTTTFSMTTTDITPTQTNVTKSGSATNVTHTADGTLTLANHDLGQVTDKLDTSWPVTDVFFRFKLTRAGSFMVDTLQVNYTTGSGIVDADITLGALYRDNNNDGLVDGGDTQIGASVSGSGGKLTFSTNFQPLETGENFLIQAQIRNLQSGDTTIFSMGASDITTTYPTGVSKPGSISDITHAANGTLALANHTVDQVGDQFSTSTPVTGIVFRFKLTKTGYFDIQTVRLKFTTSDGVAYNDLSDAELWIDDNHDGIANESSTPYRLVDNVTPTDGGGYGLITFNYDVPVSPSGTDYYVKVTAANLAAGDTTTFSLTAAEIDTVETNVSEPGSITNSTHTADGSLTLANHTAGQIADSFGAVSSYTGVIYRLKLTRTGNFTIENLRVNYTTAGGVLDADVVSGELWEDVDNDAVLDNPGDTKIQDGVIGSGGILTFTTDFIPSTSGSNYLIKATVNNLVAGDSTTLSVGTADIDAQLAPKSGSTTGVTHSAEGVLTLANHDSGQVTDKFNISTPVTDVLFRFKLTRTGALTITDLRVNYTTGTVVDEDVTSGELWEDVNNDGAVDGGDTSIQTGISGSGGKLTFTADFSPSESGTNYLIRATVANLVADDTTTFSVGTADMDGNATSESGSISNVTHTLNHYVDLAGYGGQEADKFTTANYVTGVELYHFQLTNNNASAAVTVTQIEFPLSSVTGIQSTDFSSLQIYVDTNGNGDIDTGEETAVGGDGAVDESETKITFSTSFDIAAGATVQYILKGDVINLSTADSVTIALAGSNITLSSGTVGGTPPSNATHTTDGTLVLADFGLPGQIASQTGDNMGSAASQTIMVFRFKLTSSSALVTVDSLKAHFTTTGGIANGDVTAGELWVDDGDGGFDAFQDVMIQGSITPSGGVLEFTTDFVTQAGTGANYYVRATFSNLIYVDTTTFSMSASDVTPLQTSVTPSGSVTSATHTHDPGVLPQIIYSHEASYDIYHTTYEQNAWQAETKLADTSTYPYWKVARTTPNNSEQVAVWTETDSRLYFSLWDGVSWGIGDQWMEDISYSVGDFAKNKGVSYKCKLNHLTSSIDDEPGVGKNWTSYWAVTTAVQDLGGIATNSYRCFDAAYEQTSNELLIVATRTGASFIHHVQYWTWNGKTLSGPGDYTVGSVTNTLQWVKLAPKPGSNEIAAITSDTASDVYGFIWDGSSFGNKQKLENGSLTSNTTEAIAVAYENSDTSLSAWLTGTSYSVGNYVKNQYNDYRCKSAHTSSATDEPGVGASWTTYWTLVTQAVFAWGKTYIGNSIGYATWDNISATYTTGSVTGLMGGPITWLRLATDPNSDDMILGMVANTSPPPSIETLRWDGSAWAGSSVAINSVSTGYVGSETVNRAFDLIFEYDSNHLGHAVIVYGGTGFLQYRHSTNGGATWGSELQFPSTYDRPGYWVQLERNLDNIVHLALHDADDDLNMLIWEICTSNAWATSTSYSVGNYVCNKAVRYSCIQNHASSSSSEPGVGADWATYWAVQNVPSWALSTSYAVSDYVWHNSVRYKCRVAHTSDAAREPGVGANWKNYWNLDWTLEAEITDTLERGTGTRNIEAFALVVIVPANPEFQTQPPPPNLNYNWGSENARISLKGVNFGPMTGTVEFTTSSGTQAAEILSWNPTEVLVRVPDNAISGYGIKLTNSWGKFATSTETFTVITAAPTVTGVIPTYASNFSTVDIWRVTGTNLSPDCTMYLKKTGQTSIYASSIKLNLEDEWSLSKAYSVGDYVWRRQVSYQCKLAHTSGVASEPGVGASWTTYWELPAIPPVKALNERTFIDAATFILNGAATGTWDLVIRNPDNQEVTVSNAFTVTVPAEVSSGSAANYDSAGYTNARNIVRDSAGNWWAVFRGGAEVYINKRTAGSNTWGTPVKLVGVSGALLYNNPAGVGLSHAGVGVDIYRTNTWGDNSNDRLHIVWTAGYGSEQKHLRYAKCSDLANYNLAASWSGIYLPWVTGRSYYVADVVTNGGNYYQAKLNHTSGVGGDEPGVGGSWTTYWTIRTKPVYDTLDSTASYYTYTIAAPDIVVDSQGYVHVAYFIETTAHSIKYRTNRTRSGHWDSIRAVAAEGEYNPYTTGTYKEIAGGASIDIDSDDHVHFAWSQVKDLAPIDRYLTRHVETTDWITFPNNENRKDIIGNDPEMDQDMSMPSLVVDRDNNIYVVARELDTTVSNPDDNDLWFAYYNGSTWTETNVTEDLRNDLGTDRFDEYYMDIDIESPVLGTRQNTTDHVLMTKVIGGLHWGKVIYLKWDDTTKKWDYEKDPDAGTDSQYYVSLERRSPAFYTDIAYLFYDKDTDKLKSEGVRGLGGTPTVVKLASFTAKGNGKQVLVEWVTKTEIDNLGFNLYRSTEKEGIYTKLNSKLIPGLVNSVSGRRYTYDDVNVVKGKLYYYKLEDIDLKGKKTLHGPVCVDWDGDGIPDDIDPTPGQPDPVPPSPNPGPAPIPGPTDPDEDGSKDGKGGKHSVTKVDLIEFKAYQTEYGVMLKWRTGYELNNLGFHIYREENGESYRVTADMVMGSAWFMGKGTPLNGGRSYSWWDTSGLSTQSSSLSPVKYWLEDVDLSGKRTLYGPAEIVQSVNDAQLLASRPPSDYAKKMDAKYEDFWKIEDLREKLRQVSLRFGSSTQLLTKTHKVSPSSRTLVSEPAVSEELTATEQKKRQWSLAAGPAVKLLVKEEGWYRVTQPELVAAGLDPNCKPQYLKLFVDGEQQAIQVTGSRDGRFDPADAIEFYATGLDIEFTDTRVYWLVNASNTGKRVKAMNNSGVPTASTSFLYPVERKDHVWYFPALKNGEESNFFGREVWKNSGDRTDQILTLFHLDTDVTPNAILEVALQGYTEVSHLVKVLVNENEVGELAVDGQSSITASYEIPQSWLLEGDNLVTFVPPDDEMDVTLIMSVKLSYWHTFTADDDALKLTATGGDEISIAGFTSANIRVVDITDPENSREAIGTVDAKDGGYSVTFAAPGVGVRTLLAFTDQKVTTPFQIVANHPTEWHAKQEGYTYVMIVHGDVAQDRKLYPLRRFRENHGFAVARVDVEDIYDEFSYGAKDTRALKDFLKRAMNQWVKKPRYVLLVGDATFDPRDFMGTGQFDFVPTKIVQTNYLETASDDWFVDFDNDGLPNIPIGRLPARTPEELGTIVSKIVAYEKSKEEMGGALVVAGKTLYGEEDYDFEGAVQEIGTLLEGRMTVGEILQDQMGDAAAREALLAGVNQGLSIVNFVGHGSTEIWQSLLSSDDAPTLTNGSKLPFFISMTCLNGFFHDLYTESLAEALILAEQGGAVAVWSSSGLTFPDQQHLMNQELIRQLLSSGKITIGQAAARAKAVTSDQDVRRTWILFGDPATRLKY